MAASGRNIIQIDLHHSKSVSAVLQKSIAVIYTGISLIQEPWIKKDAIRGLGGGANLFLHVPQGTQPEDMHPGEENQHRPINGSFFQRSHGGFRRPDRNW